MVAEHKLCSSFPLVTFLTLLLFQLFDPTAELDCYEPKQIHMYFVDKYL